MKTGTQPGPFARVELASPLPHDHQRQGPRGEYAAQVVRADGLTIEAGNLLLHAAGEITRSLPLTSVRAITWHHERPTAYTLQQRRTKVPNSHQPWTPQERDTLRHEISQGMTWEQISHAHGRSINAVTAEGGRLTHADK